MRAEIYRPDAPDDVVAVARWNGSGAALETLRDVHDGSLRQLGQRGEVLLQPGSIEWFRSALLVRAPKIGLAVRFVPEVAPGLGWDPAAAYRTFEDQIERLSSEPYRQS
jgi:hypothetical protein